jgi:hypothetical protein
VYETTGYKSVYFGGCMAGKIVWYGAVEFA